MIRRRIVLVYWIVAIGFFIPTAVYAYIDPATTTYIIQIITALVVTVGVSLSVFLYRFRMISAKIRYGVYAIFHRRRAAKDSVLNDSVPNNVTGSISSETPDMETFRPADQYTLPEYAIAGGANPPTVEEMEALGEPTDMECVERKNKNLNTPGKRNYGGRMRAAVLTLLAICLSFIFIGCIDLAAQNSIDMPFNITEAIPIILLCFAVCFAVMLFVVPLFRGMIFEILLSIALAVLIAGYIQGTFLNIGLGQLTGDEIVWSLYQTKMVTSTIFWICMFVAVFLLWRFAKGVWRGFTIFVPLLLIIIQGVALLSVLGAGGGNQNGVYGTEWGGSQETLSIAGEDQLATGNNTIIFLVDRLDEEYVNEIKQIDPAFFDKLDGFTQFDDNITYYCSTFPSVTSMLTGHKFYFDGPVADYFNSAWANAKMMQDMKAQGVDIKLYMARGYTYGNSDELKPYVSNILVPEYDFNARIALVKLLKLSAFRYAPMPAKEKFWMSPTEFADAITLTAEASPYITNDFAFHDMLTTQGLKVTNESGSFTYYHLLGTHDPVTMDENMQKSSNSTPARQGMGVFNIIYEYIDQMKALGLYDNATIIITGDHGILQGDYLNRPQLTGLFVKMAGSYGTPLALNHAPVCPDELAATVMTGMFGNADGFGPTYFDIKEGDPVTREYIMNLKDYIITGDGRDFANWDLVKILDNKSDWK